MSIRRTTYLTGEYLGTFLPPILAYLLLAIWAALIWQIAARAPAGAYPGPLTIQASSAPIVLGSRELGQHKGPRSAAIRHLELGRGGGEWWFSNRAYTRRVDIKTNRVESIFPQRWRLKRGDTIAFDGPTLTVAAIGPTSITLKHIESGREVTWSDGALTPKGEPVTLVCKSWISRRAYHARWALYDYVSGGNEIELFGIGGGVNCTDRWKLPGLPSGAAMVVWQRGGFWLAPEERRNDILMSRVGGKRRSFADLALPYKGPDGTIQSIILGRTKYRVRVGASTGALTLTPSLNIDFWTDEKAIPSSFERRSWIGAGRGVFKWTVALGWRVPGGLLLTLLVMAGLWWQWRRNREREMATLVHTCAAIAPAVFGIWLTMLLRTGRGAPDDLLLISMVWLAWFWATIMLVWSRRLFGLSGLLWVTAIFFAATGTMTLLQLAAGSDNSWWLGFVRKHAVVLTLFAWGICLLTAIPIRIFEKLWMRLFTREGIAAAGALVLVGLMILQFIAGGEEGIGGIQPVEVMKSMLVILLGFAGLHIAETRRRGARAYRRSPLLFILPYLRFVGLILVVVMIIVVGVRDFSPIVILGILMIAWFWKLGKVDKSEGLAIYWRAIRPLVLLFIAVFFSLGAWIYNNPDQLPTSFPQRDRILVWSQPERYQHSGSQVLSAMEHVSAGGWRGAGSWFGTNGSVLDIPAVQDDFITAFFLNKFGGIAGLVLIGFQLAFLIVLFRLSRQVQNRTAGGDFHEQNAGTVMSYTIFGLGVMQVTHWTIAWGNSLGLLPVMGQPMTWISAGNSHLLGFALLTLTIGLITAWFSRARI